MSSAQASLEVSRVVSYVPFLSIVFLHDPYISRSLRPRLSSRLWTESRSSSRHPTQTSRSMLVCPLLPRKRKPCSNPPDRDRVGTWSGAFRAISQIYSENGVRGLLQGHSATLLRIFPYAATRFIVYDQVEYVRSRSPSSFFSYRDPRTQVLMPTRESQTNLRRFIAGASAGTSSPSRALFPPIHSAHHLTTPGVTSVLLTYPLELIRVRMAYSTHHTSDPARRPTFLSAMRLIYSEGPLVSPSVPGVPANPSPQLFARFPILKFYRGFSVSIAGMIPYAGTSFLVWGYLRASLHHPYPTNTSAQSKPPSKPVSDLACGAVAGALAQTVSYPFEVVRRRMQVGGLTRPDRWLRWGETVGMIWSTWGWRGFFVGLSIGYLKVVPMTAVSFTVWQALRSIVGI